MELKVIYDGEVNSFLDETLEKTLGAFGFKRWASGYNLIENKRDLAFELIGEKLIDSEGDPVLRIRG